MPPADKTFKAFEAHGMDTFLRVVRTPPPQSPLDRPGPTPAPGQLTLSAAE
ncbi:MAG: hypothetical protein M3N47_05220 [Chloroflexota bacterium]|nr:hypothetical protein [Chloroflexota bacterium]